MANWNGKAGKGAMRTLRAVKREEAEARQASFAADVARLMSDDGLMLSEARQAAAFRRSRDRAQRAAREQ